MKYNKIYFLLIPLLIIGCNPPIEDDLESELLVLSTSELAMAKDSIAAFPSVYPEDESNQVSGFSHLRDELILAVTNRDTSFIYSILSESIRLSFGGTYGIPDFRSYWKLESDSSEFWQTISSALNLGGSFSDDTTVYTFPYMFRHYPRGIDPLFMLIATSDSSKVYSTPEKSSVFDTVRYTAFEELFKYQINDDYSDEYRPVRIMADRYAFVKRAEFRSPVDYRGGFEKEDGEWKLTFWIAGD